MSENEYEKEYENNSEAASLQINTTSNKLPQLHLSAFVLDKELQGFSKNFSGKLIKTGPDLVGSEVRKRIIMIVEQFTQDANILTSTESKKIERNKILAMNTIINFVHNSLESRIGVHNINAVFEATYAALNNAVGIQSEGRKLTATLFGNYEDDIPKEETKTDGSGY